MKRHRKQMPQGMLFDMDGTLVLTTQRAEHTWQSVFEQFQPLHQQAPEHLHQLMQEMYAAYKRAIAEDSVLQRRDRLHPFEVRTELVARVLAATGMRDDVLATSMVQAYETQRDHHRRVSPSATETLNHLRTQGIRLALLTNGNASYQRRKLAQHHLTASFDTILIEEEFGVGKPDPRMYQAALEQLSLSVDATWMVGDNLWLDVGAPQQLGLFTLWFDPRRKGLPPETQVCPDCIIHTLPEILQCIENNASS